MKKQLLVLLGMAGMQLPLVALADTANVDLYGVANLSFDVTDNGTAANGAAGVRTHKVSSNASRIGFRGSENLGGGLSAVWQVESRVDMDNAGGTFGTRNTFAGLRGDSWGQVLLGRYDGPYRNATSRLDPFRDSIGDNRALMGGAFRATFRNSYLGFDSRPTDGVFYISPNLNGFTVSAAYIAGAESATTSTDIKGKTWSLGGTYEAGPIFASLGYQVNDIGSSGTGVAAGNAAGTVGVKEQAWKLGAGYKFEAVGLDVGFAYEKTSDNFRGTGSVVTCASGSTDASNCYGHSAWLLSGKYRVATGALKLVYSKADELGNTTATGARQWVLGYDHNLSKRTNLYLIYAKINNDRNASYGVGGNDGGINTGFVNPVGAGASPSAVSLGMRHSF